MKRLYSGIKSLHKSKDGTDAHVIRARQHHLQPLQRLTKATVFQETYQVHKALKF